MILIEAEAKNRLNDDAGAHDYFIQNNRDVKAVKSKRVLLYLKKLKRKELKFRNRSRMV
jgi:hypothetical protein